MSNPAGIPITDGLVLAIIPAYRSLLDFSGAGRDPTIAGTGLQWVRRNGVYQILAESTGRLIVANDPTLEAVTSNSLFVAGALGSTTGSSRVFSKRDVGGTQVEVNLLATDKFELNDGLNFHSLILAAGRLNGVRSFCVTAESGQVAKVYLDGSFEGVFSGISTFTGDDADISILNYYTGALPYKKSTTALLWYNRVLTADEISVTHAFTDSLTSPTISPNRRYFDRGSWVPNGPQPSYGDTGPDLVVDGDMEAVGTAAWIVANDAALTKVTGTRTGGSGTQILKVAYTITNDPYAAQATHTVGKRYQITGWARGDNTAYPRVFNGTGAPTWVGTTSTDWQYFDTTNIATFSNLLIQAQILGAGYCEFDDVSVEQTNNLLSDGMMEDGTTGEWTAVAATLTKETTSPQEGVQWLKVAWSAGGFGYASRTPFVVGRKYRITGYGKGDGTNDPRIYINGGGLKIWNGTTSTAWQAFDVEITPTTTDIWFYANMVGGFIGFDQVLVREVFKTVGAWDLGVITNREVADKTGAANHGTVVGNVSPVFTEVGRAAHFDGVSGQVALAAMAPGASWTITALARIDLSSASYKPIIYTRDGEKGFVLNAYNDTFRGGGGDVSFSFADVISSSVTLGTWHLLHLVWDGTNYSLYMDGALEDGPNAADYADSTNPVYIGSIGAGSYFGGAIQNVVLSQGEKTAGEIKAEATKIARTPLYYEDMSNAIPTVTPIVAGQQIPGTEYTVESGTFDVVAVASPGTNITEPKSGQLLLDGDMEAVGVGDWDGVIDAVISKETSDPKEGARNLRITATAQSGSQYPQTKQTILTVGKRYRYRGWGKSDGTQVPKITASTTVWTGGTSGSWEYFDVVHVATLTSVVFNFGITDPAGTEYVEFDDITVEETQQLLSDGMMESSGVGAWISERGGSLTKSTANPYAGTQAIRITYGGQSNAAAGQDVITVGVMYRVTGWARGDGVIPPRILTDDGITTVWVGVASTSWQQFDVTFVGGVNNIWLAILGGGAGNWVEYDNVEVHRVQPDRMCTEVMTAGLYHRRQPFAYGTQRVSFYKGPGFTQPVVIFVASVPADITDAAQNGYALTMMSNTRVHLQRITNGAATSLWYTAESYVEIGVKYDFYILRDNAGVITVYIKGGVYTTWTLVVPFFGSNPFTDNTHTTSQYIVYDFDIGDRHYLDTQYLGPVVPV